MKKTALFLSIILLTGSLVTINAQKNRTLGNGFSINLIAGIPAPNYGIPEGTNSNEASAFNLIAGIQLGNRWYFGSSEKFKMGIMVNWLDITFSTMEEDDLLSRIVADASFLELGPIGTFVVPGNIALDAYYNLRPTFFTHLWHYPAEDLQGYLGTGFSHAIGTAFRWKVFSVGIEYVIGNIRCEYTEQQTVENGQVEYSDLDLVNSGFRLMIGAKF